MKRERLARGIEVLAARYDVRVGDGAYAATGYLAGDDARRADELNGYLRDPDVRGIVCARGGYGLMRILPALDRDALVRDPKVIVGFSDATALLAWALGAGVRCVHGPVATQLGQLPAADREWLFRLLEQPAPAGPVPAALTAVGAPAAGPVEGPIAGGNLTLVAHLVGTPYACELDGAIALLEDVGERPYAIDRYLTRLHLAGALAGCRAALIGDFVGCDEPRDAAQDPLAVVDERLRAFALAGARAAPIGHGPRNLALPLGARARLDASAGTLELLDPAVA